MGACPHEALLCWGWQVGTSFHGAVGNLCSGELVSRGINFVQIRFLFLHVFSEEEGVWMPGPSTLHSESLKHLERLGQSSWIPLVLLFCFPAMSTVEL